MSGQTLKSAMTGRVDISLAQRLASQRQDLGEGAMCAGGYDAYFDQYGRIADVNTLPVKDASCSHYTGITSADYMQYENNHRPYVGIASAGLRGGDTMGVGRDSYPNSMYGPGSRQGAFVRQGNHLNNILPAAPHRAPEPVVHRKVAPFNFSLDATTQRLLL